MIESIESNGYLSVGIYTWLINELKSTIMKPSEIPVRPLAGLGLLGFFNEICILSDPVWGNEGMSGCMCVLGGTPSQLNSFSASSVLIKWWENKSPKRSAYIILSYVC